MCSELYGKFGPEIGDIMQSVPADSKLMMEYRLLQFSLALESVHKPSVLLDFGLQPH